MVYISNMGTTWLYKLLVRGEYKNFFCKCINCIMMRLTTQREHASYAQNSTQSLHNSLLIHIIWGVLWFSGPLLFADLSHVQHSWVLEHGGGGTSVECHEAETHVFCDKNKYKSAISYLQQPDIWQSISGWPRHSDKSIEGCKTGYKSAVSSVCAGDPTIRTHPLFNTDSLVKSPKHWLGNNDSSIESRKGKPQNIYPSQYWYEPTSGTPYNVTSYYESLALCCAEMLTNTHTYLYLWGVKGLIKLFLKSYACSDKNVLSCSLSSWYTGWNTDMLSILAIKMRCTHGLLLVVVK